MVSDFSISFDNPNSWEHPQGGFNTVHGVVSRTPPSSHKEAPLWCQTVPRAPVY